MIEINDSFNVFSKKCAVYGKLLVVNEWTESAHLQAFIE